jgi:hypothetical protein
VPQNALGKGSVTVTWRRDGDFSLPSARQKVLGKEGVADVQFAERSLPSVTLDKGFAECTIVFAVCLETHGKDVDSGSGRLCGTRAKETDSCSKVTDCLARDHRPFTLRQTDQVVLLLFGIKSTATIHFRFVVYMSLKTRNPYKLLLPKNSCSRLTRQHVIGVSPVPTCKM